MKKIGLVVVLSLLAGLFVSCVSLQDRPLSVPERREAEIIGTVSVVFQSVQFIHIQNRTRIRARAYNQLLESARRRYGDNVDVRNIEITGEFSALNVLYFVIFPFAPLLGNTQRIMASGDVVLLDNIERIATTGVEDALERAAETIARNLPTGSRIAIAYISGAERGYASLFDGRLEHFFLAQGFNVFDRSQLDIVRAEQQLGLDFVVDERTIVRIGHITGVSVLITGRIVVAGTIRELQLRALDTTTARLIGSAIEPF